MAAGLLRARLPAGPAPREYGANDGLSAGICLVPNARDLSPCWHRTRAPSGNRHGVFMRSPPLSPTGQVVPLPPELASREGVKPERQRGSSPGRRVRPSVGDPAGEGRAGEAEGDLASVTSRGDIRPVLAAYDRTLAAAIQAAAREAGPAPGVQTQEPEARSSGREGLTRLLTTDLPARSRDHAARIVRTWWMDATLDGEAWATWLRSGGMLWRHEWISAVVTLGAHAPWQLSGEALSARIPMLWSALHRQERIGGPGRALLRHAACPSQLWREAFRLRDVPLTLELLRSGRRHHDVGIAQWLRTSRQPVIQHALLADPSCRLDRGWGAKRLQRMDPTRALGLLLWRWEEGTLEPLPRVPMRWLSRWLKTQGSAQTLALVQALWPLAMPNAGAAHPADGGDGGPRVAAG